ncbi:heterokaryon incompatibility protein-domain-containing protein [Phaeosphaeriaceae sp. PMI808]|nr:heterokaryon incompatibility protein-domain-containing protein [Phaeosphaeriaceae sp. PMI808]
MALLTAKSALVGILVMVIGTPLLLVVVMEIAVHKRRSGKFLFEMNRKNFIETLITKCRLTTTKDLVSSTAATNDTREHTIIEQPTKCDGKSLDKIKTIERQDSADVWTMADISEPNLNLYSYSPLLELEIRLLEVPKLGNETRDVQAKLVHIPLTEAQAKGYVALSYTWGSAKASTTIIVDEKIMGIDAICINQSDLVECNAQVVRMQRIYAGAQTVIIALEAGATENADSVLKLLSFVEPTISPANQLTQVNEMLDNALVQSALEEFWHDKYWRRIWILQEFVIGHNVNLLIGNGIVAASKLKMLLKRSRSEQSHQVNTIYRIRESWQMNRPFQLLPMLIETQKSQCQRRHDRVFGLLGLCIDGLKYLIEPDYRTGLLATTLAMTRSYIAKNLLNIILLAPHCSSSSTLPSWCPDFFRFDKYPPDNRVCDLIASKHANKPFGTDTMTVNSEISFRGDVLLTPARSIGTIRNLGSAWSETVQDGFPTCDANWSRKIDLS